MKAWQWWMVPCVFASLAIASCNKDDDKPDASVGSSQLGETCERSSDCASSLACVQGRCAQASLNLTPNGNECAVVQCATAGDCCTNFVAASATTCSTYQMMCAQDPVVYATYCTLYQQDCVCDTTQFTCQNDRCQAKAPTCTLDGDCLNLGGLARFCVGDACVQCKADTDCAQLGAKCVKNQCLSGCITNGDCPDFQDCSDGACVEVGCTSDRQCIVLERSANAFCDPGTKSCSVRCERDVQCAADTNGMPRVCVNGACVDAGCETDEECKLILPQSAAVPGQHLRVVCRPKSN